MNFFGQLLKDESYPALLDESPCPAIALVGGIPSTRQSVADGVRQACSGLHQMRIHTFNTITQLYAKKSSGPRDTRPSGILKRHWCQKHQQRVYGCVGVLLDWDSVRIPERQQFEQHVQQFLDTARAHLRMSVNTKVMLLLTTKLVGSTETPPCGSYLSMDEALLSLRGKLGLDAKGIAILYREGVDEYAVSRLQRLFQEHCVRYHREEIARLKRVKGDVGKAGLGPQHLQARIRFKSGWHCLVLRDYKLMRHHMEKAYTTLRNINNASSSAWTTFEERAVATICMWHMVAANLSQLAQSTHTTKDVVLSSLVKTIADFQSHLRWVCAPYPREATDIVLSPQMTQFLHCLYLAEWYEMLARKAVNVLDIHRLAVPKEYLSCAPGLLFQSAVESLERARGLLLAAKVQNTDNVVATPSPPLFCGTEYRSASLYCYAVQQTTVDALSSRLFELALQGLRHLVGFEMPRMQLKLMLSVALHSFTVQDYWSCFEKLSLLLQSHRGFVLRCEDELIMCEIQRLMTKTCRKLIQSTATAAPSTSQQDTEKDAESRHMLSHELLSSMLAMLTNRSLEAAGHKMVCAELARNVRDKVIPSVLTATFPQRAMRSFNASFQACAYFTSPFVALRSKRDQSLILQLSTSSRIPLTLLDLGVVVSEVLEEGTFVPDSTTQAARQLTKLLNDALRTLGASMTLQPDHSPTSIVLSVSQCRALGLFELTSITAKLLLSEEGGEQTAISVEFPFLQNSEFYGRFDHCTFDQLPDAWVPLANAHSVERRHRPVMRVVRPPTKLNIHVIQREHAIEGELYELEVVIQNRSKHRSEAVLEKAHLLLPYLDSVLEITGVVEPSSSTGERLERLTESEPGLFARHGMAPIGYKMKRLEIKQSLEPGATLRRTLRWHCKKGGKFEIPIRLSYNTSRCKEMALTVWTSVMVCHPVFVSYQMTGSSMWSARGPEDPNGELFLAKLSDGRAARFMESSVLREKDLGDDGDSSSSLTDSTNVWKMVKADSRFGPFQLPLSDLLATNHTSWTANNMFYSVERTPQETEARGLMTNGLLDVTSGETFVILVRVANALQCGLRIRSITVKRDEGVLLRCPGMQCIDWELNVDEELTYTVGLTHTRQGRQQSLGSLVLLLQRTGAAEGDLFSFELPLPMVNVTTGTLVTASLQYPSETIAGEAFPCTARFENAGLVPRRIQFQVGGGDGANQAPVQASGRTNWTFVLMPGEAKSTTLRFTAMFAGTCALPSLAAVVFPEGEVLLRSDDIRTLTVLPSFQQTLT